MADQMQDFVPAEVHQSLVQKYNELYKLYKTLSAEHAKCEPHIKKANDQYTAAKTSAREWTKYLESKGYIPKKDVSPARTSSPRKVPNDESAKGVTSSQTTEGELADFEPEDAAAVSDDEPEIVSERTIKRRKPNPPTEMPQAVKIKLEPASPSRPILVNSEGNSSPVREQRKPVRVETSDLDAIKGQMRTPRKRRPSRAQSEETTRPPILLPNTSSLSESNLADLCDDHDAAVTKSAISDEGTAIARRDFARRTGSNFAGEQVLRQRDPNIANGPRKDDDRTRTMNKRKRESRRTGILSEDGDDHSSQVVLEAPQIKTETSADRRLDVLLDDALPEKQPLQPAKTNTKPLQRSKPSPVPAGLTSATARTPPVRQPNTTPKIPHKATPRPPSPKASGPPLRSRSPSRLRLEDFKINPNYLGAAHAFADPIRGREQRRCLPGCMRPECCGAAFRSLAELGALRDSKTDVQVLEEYLGPEFASIMGAYGPEKRRELLVQARAFALANAHGKHRNAFERRATPPGFWRTDMPSTQEEEEDRRRAAELEQKQVEERWAEALRGGRWMFRDE
ncbi:DNA repair protein endonuclease SAE2/CtIP C-terminus-domain-containing protein [Neohortaea acidophila]|uniref:DNA repair protein endonuclease SAE2/CtIP C-terminus-domain-containing protein n=1 Tax=Neohortaea acidophila TaxID=245834 RepID=A0A6A6PF76_9PEZI|nr:DNA repair protein endonuclease SAE2/CtIP C-terminus-domain-containing protein [Neohortaea acidophila]KAF2478600.1 DNA repair protein endonuclease SAE2/CtIP C-terminus-domain-containing protein [Neohortaea acidophila]